MKNKRILTLVLALALALSVAFVFASCGKDCTEHVDANSDLKCDECGAAISAPCSHLDENGDFKCDKCSVAVEHNCTTHTDGNDNGRCDLCGSDMEAASVDVTVTLKDQDNNAIAGALIKFSQDGTLAFSGTTDENGTAVVTVDLGTYSVVADIETLPAGYLAYTKQLEVTADAAHYLALEAYNNNPNGTAERPYPLGNTDETDTTVTISANTTYNYIVWHPSNRTITFTAEGIKVVYNSTEYTPDENGKITFRLTETGNNEQSKFTITNTTAAELEIGVSFVSPLGSQSNPIVITELGTPITANTAAENQVHYTFTVTETGTFTVTADSGDKNIIVSCHNGDFVYSNEYMNPEATTATIDVVEGYTVVITVSSVEAAQVVFTPTFAAASTDEAE